MCKFPLAFPLTLISTEVVMVARCCIVSRREILSHLYDIGGRRRFKIIVLMPGGWLQVPQLLRLSSCRFSSIFCLMTTSTELAAALSWSRDSRCFQKDLVEIPMQIPLGAMDGWPKTCSNKSSTVSSRMGCWVRQMEEYGPAVMKFHTGKLLPGQTTISNQVKVLKPLGESLLCCKSGIHNEDLYLAQQRTYEFFLIRPSSKFNFIFF